MSDETWEPTLFAIGAEWPWEPEWISERRLGWFPDTNVLLIVEDNVTAEMIATLKGPIELVLVGHGPLVGFLIRLGGVWDDWGEALTWRRPGQGVPDGLKPELENEHLLFSVVLVDRVTKRIAHMRLFTASAHFTKMLYREVADRWKSGISEEAALLANADWQQRYPTIRAALKAGIARTRAGD